MQTNFIIDLIKRLKTESPRFFKILQIVSFIIALICGAATFLLEKNLWHPANIEALKEVLKAATTFFTGSLFAAMTTTTKAELQDDKTKENVLRDTTYN